MTRSEKDSIRGYYHYLDLRFRADGSVDARPGVGHPWGILYTKEDAERHIAAVSDQSKRKLT
jgi:hypothetical protein